MSAPDYDHDELCVGILAQDLRNAFARHGVEDKLIMLSTRKLNPDDEDEYYCIEYTHFFYWSEFYTMSCKCRVSTNV